MTRIVAGDLGGRTLAVPTRGTRPTSERVREALFSRLEHEGAVQDAQVLDLYAGSGALGLEAISRGAARAVLVDRDPGAARVCRSNAAALGVSDTVEVVAGPALKFVQTTTSTFDLILIDPPYGLAETEVDLVLAGVVGLLRVEGVVVVERSSRQHLTWPDGVVGDDDRRYGETRIWTGVKA